MESKIEREFAEWVRQQGGLCLKLNANWYRSIPDRLVVLPGGMSFFIEFKQPGGAYRPGQRKMLHMLRRRGFHAYVCRSVKQAQELYVGYTDGRYT